MSESFDPAKLLVRPKKSPPGLSSKRLVRDYSRKIAKRRRKETFEKFFFNSLTILSTILIVAIAFRVL